MIVCMNKPLDLPIKRPRHEIFNLLPSNWHVPIILSPENLWRGVAVYRAIELHGLAGENAGIGWNLLERWLDCKDRMRLYRGLIYMQKVFVQSCNFMLE